MGHQLLKTGLGWKCELCHQTWKGKPRGTCPGARLYDGPTPKLATIERLASQNLKPSAPPAGCYKKGKGKELHWLYNPDQVEIKDPALPRIYTWSNRPKTLQTPRQLYRYNRKPGTPQGCIWNEGDWVFLYDWKECPVDSLDLPPYQEFGAESRLKTKAQLRKENLAPKSDAQPAAFYRVWDAESEWWVTVLLYDPAQCEWSAPDNFITASTLRSRYLLSTSWLNRIGKPDIIAENPHHPRWKPMQLYSRQRVEGWLADHSEEYADWLEKRDRYVEIFEANREAIAVGHQQYLERQQAQRNQQRQCLRCASGIAMNQGFLCVVYPLGLSPEQIPCVDFVERSKTTN
jgi:hypothetical protein